MLVSITWRASSQVLVEEGVAQAVAGVGHQRVDRPPPIRASSLSTPSVVERSTCSDSTRAPRLARSAWAGLDEDGRRRR
jgi:hypothetical protein